MNCLWCGCSRETHEHFRPGSDCGRCGNWKCPAFIRTRVGYWLAWISRRW